MGVASKPVEPRPHILQAPLRIAENLKLIHRCIIVEIIKISILYCYVYTMQFGIHKKKARGCNKVMVNFSEYLFYSNFFDKDFFSKSIHDNTMTS